MDSQREATWNQVHRVARKWRSLAKSREGDGDLCRRQAEELERLDAEAEALREQNRQVLVSMHQAQEELQWSLAETRRLREREAGYEGDLLRAAERSAELAGHANPKQKIKHLMDLKAENSRLRAELKKTVQQVVQTKAQLRTSHVFDSAARGERSGALRQVRARRRASEREAVEYQLLAAAAEQVLALHSGLASYAGVAPSTGADGSAEPGALLRRLRELAADLAAAGGFAPAQAPGSADGGAVWQDAAGAPSAAVPRPADDLPGGEDARSGAAETDLGGILDSWLAALSDAQGAGGPQAKPQDTGCFDCFTPTCVFRQ